MLTVIVIAAAIAVAAIARTLPTRIPKALPPAGPPPQSRTEAVRRVLKHIERKTIAELAEGEGAVIIGTVIGEATMVSPISGVSCIGYHLRIHDASIERRQLHDEARCGAFTVRDDTGTIAVDVTGLELAMTSTQPSFIYPPPPQAVAVRVPAYYHLPLVVEESVLLAGMRVLVCGVVTREVAATDYRDGRTNLRLQASATFPLVASTDADLFVVADRPIAPEELHRR